MLEVDMKESHGPSEQDEFALPHDSGLGNDDNDDDATEVRDYRGFGALTGGNGRDSGSEAFDRRRQQLNAQSIRRGEKDFEEHGTRAQLAALEQSRSVMESVLAYTRRSVGSKETDIMCGWYFPDTWSEVPDMAEETERSATGRGEGKEETTATPTTTSRPKEPRFAHVRQRVVMVEAGRGVMLSSVGAVPGKRVLERRAQDGGGCREMEDGNGKHSPQNAPIGCDRVWLLPEEALFLMERGSMELWWPLRPLEEILAGEERRREPAKQGEGETAEDQVDASGSGKDEYDKENNGIPLSLEAAYSLLVEGGTGEGSRGHIPLPAYQVYTHLRRSGYHVLRAVRNNDNGGRGSHDQQHGATLSSATPAVLQPTGLWSWILSLLPSSVFGAGLSQQQRPAPKPYGPLVQPGFYRSYEAVYAQLALGFADTEARQQNHDNREMPLPPQPTSFRIFFHVWKASSAFSKSRPPPPDFYLAVTDAHASGVPTLAEMTSLLDEVPTVVRSNRPAGDVQQPTEKATGGRRQPAALGTVYRRLKQGHRSVVVGVVDHGIINYVQFTDGGRGSTFVEEPLWPRFDAAAAWRVNGQRRNDKAGKTGNVGKGKSKGNGKGSGKGKGKGHT